MEFHCCVDNCPSTLQQEDIYERRKQNLSSFKSVDYVSEEISYEDFFLRYLIPNKPCVFSCKHTRHWRSRAEWVDEQGKPKFEFLKTNFGNAKVPVAICNEKEFDSHPKVEQTFSDYLEYWQDYISNSYPSDNQCLYLKDWHFVRAFPEYNAYKTPLYFCSDWLNEFWDTGESSKDDYRFVYMGPKGSWTPFHADVLHSYSWSANICGKKQWLLFPPGEEVHLRDKFGNLAFDVTSEDVHNPEMYPNYQKLSQQYKVVQHPGEIIFVPSGWHHQVWNVEDTISINHNWLNGCSIDLTWNFLKRNLKDVENEISDCRGMEGWNQQCQVVLKSLTGSDYTDFFELCNNIGTKHLQFLSQSDICSTNEECDRGVGHCKIKGSQKEEQKEMTGNTSAEVSQHPNADLEFQEHFVPLNNKCHSVFDLNRLRIVLESLVDTEQLECQKEVQNLLHQLNSVF
ncbi:2-oxoglutarate and iron-dependent oxygenase JMJD4-like isoform X1 [Octopus sinensis]|uniref:2-oxoglutarate and iron-dependent oxygenase JMJD4 n=1 Tax=Octopus sinensis TaxID=2607531 RepID=A0A6P7TJY3_9MOLL|nr:2-oxoglutarate and iron-dependent oxygenase JMJD4-like isoform X1 [Octopus sinensis]